MPNLTMTLDLDSREVFGGGTAPAGLLVREPATSDINHIGGLYHHSYPPGVAGANPTEAIRDIADTFNGNYGELWLAGSAVGEIDGDIVGVLLTIREAHWDGTPEGPFIIELFVEWAWRERGIARHLMGCCLDTMRGAGARTVALRVRDDNHQALSLYDSLGFTEWVGDEPA